MVSIIGLQSSTNCTVDKRLFNYTKINMAVAKSAQINFSNVRVQGCHWSGKSQGNSRSGKSQGILEFVREILNFVESQGNSRKVREISENLYFIRGCGDQLASPKISARAFGARIIFFNTLHSKFAFIHKGLLFETYTGHVQNDY